MWKKKKKAFEAMDNNNTIRKEVETWVTTYKY
jgi:hypothetical protein